MYGTFWCPHCADQKALFGDAFSDVQYVECDPRGSDARPEICASKGITGVPTWEIDGRLYPGVMTLESLAELSDYEGP